MVREGMSFYLRLEPATQRTGETAFQTEQQGQRLGVRKGFACGGRGGLPRNVMNQLTNVLDGRWRCEQKPCEFKAS